MPLKEVSLTRVLKARRERVFEAWTRPELMARWFFPANGWSATAEADLRVGGRWTVVMRDSAGVRHEQFGEYREITPSSRLVFTWSCPDLKVEHSLVTVELDDRHGHTELRLRHELPADPEVLREHEGGWNGCLQQLSDWLAAAEQGGNT
jgi:uncharacterized protein YndB with AHSA1/START domain